MVVISDQLIATGSCQRPRNHSGHWEHVVKVWNIAKHKLMCKMEGHTGGISGLVKIDEQHLASSSGDNTLRIWNCTEKENSSILKGHEDYVYSLSLNGKNLVSASKDRTVRVWDVEKETEVFRLADKVGLAHASSVYDVKVRDNTAVTCSRDGYVKIWDLRTKACMKMLDPEDGFVYGVDFLSDDKIAVGTSGVSSKKEGKNKYKKPNGNVAIWEFSVL
jgi:WD40 repeat protein